MSLNSIDFNILKHLHALLEDQSVSKAAKRAGVTQSAMSKSLKKIREVFKDEILIEKGKHYDLTEKALTLKPLVSQQLKSLELVFNPTIEFDPLKEEAKIKIVSSDYGTLVLGNQILEKLKHFPLVNVEFYSPQEQDLNRLQDEDIDFYLGIGSIQLLPSKLRVKKLGIEKLETAVSRTHPLAKKQTLTVEDFISFPHLLISNLNLNTGKNNLVYNKGVVDFALEEINKKRQVSAVVPHFTSAPLLLKNSSLILSAPSKVLRYFEPLVDLKVFPLPVEIKDPADFYLAWHEASLQKRANKWFKQNILDSLEI